MIDLQEVTKSVNQFQLGPVTMNVKAGAVTAIIGSNGTGKSTFIQLLTGMVFPDGGKIARFEFEDIEETWKEFIGYIPQTSLGYERFTLKQLAELHQIGYEKWGEGKFKKLVKNFDIPLNKEMDTLSTGMQKKALAILALSRDTKLLIMDEPFSGVDLQGQEMLKQEWISYLEEDSNRAIVFATHVPEEVKEFADYIVCLQGGKIAGEYEKDELLLSYGRLWIQQMEKFDDLRNLPSIIDVKRRGNQLEIITKERMNVIAALEDRGIEIELEQSLRMAEILYLLLQEKEGVEKT